VVSPYPDPERPQLAVRTVCAKASVGTLGTPLDTPRVPFVDLAPTHRVVKERILGRIEELIDLGHFTNGAPVLEFERAFAEYCDRRHSVGVSSGLDALRLALIASGLDGGAGVIVPAATFAATFEAVIQAGGVPVVVDVGELDYGIDVSQVDSAADRATHVVPVHLYGQMADMTELGTGALEIVEDACQAHGAVRDGLRAGKPSRAAAFSFYPAKNLGAMGDAGAVVTDDEDLAELARALRTHGETRKYHHEHVGYTARLDAIQAVVLAEKLAFLEEWNALRRDAARYYTEALDGLHELRLPTVPEGSAPVWHLYVVRVQDPGTFRAFLTERGIATARHYPEPPHLAPAYRGLGFGPGDFPVAEALARECVSLPIYPGITESQLEWTCSSISDFFHLDTRRLAGLRDA
jgi:dTDP-4-amino-4,6-dideoxygalactose transaminase